MFLTSLCINYYEHRFGWLLDLDLHKEDYLQIFRYVSFWLYSFCGV